MDRRTVLFLLILLILLVLIYCIFQRDPLIEHWGWLRRVTRRFVPTPKKIFNRIKNAPKAALNIVKNPRRSIKKAASSIKKKGSSTFGKIASLAKKITGLAKKVKNLDKVFIGIKNKVYAVGDVFKSVFGVTKEGFDLLRGAIVMLIEVAQILYLVVDKLKKCNKGMAEVAAQYKRELDIIVRELNNIQNRVYKCITFQYGFGVEHYNKCIKSLFDFRIDIMKYTKKIDILLKNPKLFAQSGRTRYGQTNAYCRNIRGRKNFRYSKSCNQCFNNAGLIAKGNRQLLGVVKLMNDSEDLFRQLGNLKRSMNRLF
jgi:hypothetical protein